MARRTREVVITAENRDHGKKFLLTEVPAVQAEEWGVRAIMALGTSGYIIPQELADAGLMGVAIISYQAFMGARTEEVLPLWREMIPACVRYKSPTSDAAGADILMPWSPTLVEEVSTLLTLRQQIMELHTGFTLAELALRLKTGISALQRTNSPITSMSPAQSEQS